MYKQIGGNECYFTLILSKSDKDDKFALGVKR